MKICKGTVSCDEFLYVEVQSALDQVWDCKSKVPSGNLLQFAIEDGHS